MASSNQISPGMTIAHLGKLFRVESSVKVTAAKGPPFIKAKLKNLVSGELTEKNFKNEQSVKVVSLLEKNLEFLYLEGKQYFFLDTDVLEQVLVDPEIVGKKSEYLKEGVEVKANFYGETIFSIELPQFLELMVVNCEEGEDLSSMGDTSKTVVLETGAKIGAPPFIEVGDIIKVDTKSHEYIQRV